jgi:hypothetical protein
MKIFLTPSDCIFETKTVFITVDVSRATSYFPATNAENSSGTELLTEMVGKPRTAHVMQSSGLGNADKDYHFITQAKQSQRKRERVRSFKKRIQENS